MTTTPTRQVHFLPYLDQIYEKIRDECLKKRKLFVDTKFSLETSQFISDETKKTLIWRRPYDITARPKFLIKTPHRRDPGQGELSDCWFVVAVANITLHRQIFERVVPIDQTFDKNQGYAGIFHFHFWQFGFWYDIVIDDYLPFNKKTLQPWCSWNRQEPEEFWVALIEKAYAKLNGGYRNLIGGAPIEAFTDLTAGVEQRFKLNESIEDRDQFFQFLLESLKHSCLMACSINPKSDGSDLEEIKANGLVVGHSYSITAIRYLQYNNRLLRMIRVRNPWANEIEWAGAWHNRDIRWHQLGLEEQKRMSWQDSEDGEFWMSFDDFFNEFDILELCHLSPDTFEEELLIQLVSHPTSVIKDHRTSFRVSLPAMLLEEEESTLQRKTWSCLSFDDRWIENLSSGGRCVSTCEHGCNFWINPQYEVETGADDKSVSCAIVISLMQKNNRLKPIDNPIDRYDYIQARIYRIKTEDQTFVSSRSRARRLIKKHYGPDDVEYIGYTGSYINRREVTLYVRVPTGKYLVIPSLYEPNRSGEFLLRIFLESNYSSRISNSSQSSPSPLTRFSLSQPVQAGRVERDQRPTSLCPFLDEQLDRSMFKTKRKEHHHVIETLAKMPTDVKRYKAVQMLMDQVFKVLNDSQIALTSASFVPSVSAFPTDETTREHLALLLENVLFLGDLALFFPDVFHRFYDQDQHRRVLTAWCYSFAVETEFYDESSSEILSLMAQELNLIEKSENFHNPYVFKETAQKSRSEIDRTSSSKKKQEKVKKKRGPGLSGNRIEL